MRRAEGIVDVEIAALREFARECRIVRLFLGMKADVLEEHEAAVGDGVRCGDGRRAHAVVDERDRRAEPFAEARRDGPQRILRIGFAVGPSQMRENDRLGAALAEPTQGLERGNDARFIADLAVLHRDVQVFAEQYALAADVARVAQRPKLQFRPLPASSSGPST